ncbi:MAG TPA: hypothetical protein VJ208_02145 [Candidatus Nanoarchaeia archaeon]|nr:hypothetical protein [Candidatus Nanoarchaeia archaeon]
METTLQDDRMLKIIIKGMSLTKNFLDRTLKFEITGPNGTYSSVENFLKSKGKMPIPPIRFREKLPDEEDYACNYLSAYNLGKNSVINMIVFHNDFSEHRIKVAGFLDKEISRIMADIKDNSGRDSYLWLECWREHEEREEEFFRQMYENPQSMLYN